MSGNSLENKKVLVCGGAGSIGSEIVRQLSEKNEVYILDNNETAFFDLLEELKLDGKKVVGRVGDIREYFTLEQVFADFLPEIVFHAAAYKHVTPMEWNPEEAVKTNVFGTLNLLTLCKKNHVRMVFISTDKAVEPESVMGMTKRIGEIIVRNAGQVSVRFANVLGSRGSVIPIWQKQIDEHKDLTVTHPDMERYFMSIPQAVSLVIEASQVCDPGQIAILDMGKPIRIIELAQKIIEESGANVGIRQIGVRRGEAMTEKLMTDEEKGRAVRKGNLWILN